MDNKIQEMQCCWVIMTIFSILQILLTIQRQKPSDEVSFWTQAHIVHREVLCFWLLYFVSVLHTVIINWSYRAVNFPDKTYYSLQYYHYLLSDETGSLMRCRRRVSGTFGWRCCRDYNCGNRFRRACCHVLLELLRLHRLDANLCGLSLLLKLLQLLRCDEADWFVPCDQLRASRHGGQDDVPAQTADVCVQTSFHYRCGHNTLALQWLVEDREGHSYPCR